MIVKKQKNIKVHFASTEATRHICALKAAGVPYWLFTIFPLICREMDIKGGMGPDAADKLGQVRYEHSKHCIMDSGLFTLMFGSHAGKKDSAFIEKWYGHIVEYVRRSGYKGTLVEVDCQKVLGPEKAWELRERMKKDLPNNRQINVFHIEDGREGLDRLIEFSDYLAISVPELRMLGKLDRVEQLAHYIKRAKPDIDIHLLGCTDKAILKRCNFCTTADSTSWLSGVRYGDLELSNGQSGHIDSLRPESYMKYEADIIKWHKKFGSKITATRKACIIALAAAECKAAYAKAAGDQS